MKMSTSSEKKVKNKFGSIMSLAFEKRKFRIRAKLRKSKIKTRLSIFISNQHLYAQVIDDSNGVTLCSCSTKSLKKKGANKENAALIGTTIAELAKKEKVSNVVFDRGGYLYHGIVKILADSAREKGLIF